MRLFVAVWPPETVRAVLDGLPRPEHEALRWTSPDEWHVTLAFLGEVAEDRLDDVRRALGTVQLAEPVRADLGPRTRRLGRSVCCVAVGGLERLAGEVGTALRNTGFELEERPFRGHLTLARSRGRRPVPAGAVGRTVEARWPVTSFSLVQSSAGGPPPAGESRYRKMGTWPVGEAPDGP